MDSDHPTSTPTEGDTPPFLVGIAGASSSGKTVLSLVLSEIFQAAMGQGQQNNASASTSSTNTTSPITIMSQDDYFVPKSECPRTTFRPRPGDETVVAGHVRPDGMVEAVDTDCLAAVDWIRLLGDLDAFLAGQKQHHGASEAAPNVASTRQTELALYRTRLDSLVAPEMREWMIADVRACVDEQVMLNSFDKFEGRLFKKGPDGAALLNCRLGFVEGFLLYARPPFPPPLYCIPPYWLGDWHDNGNSSSQQHFQQHFQQHHHHQRPESSLPPAVKASQEAIRDRFDTRLYLHVTTEVTCQRRFSRVAYIDHPDGQRMPGQMWKTKGYFFDVVKANFYKYDLVDSTLTTQLWQGQSILANAVTSILDKMKEYEDKAREVAKENRAREEEAMARVKGETNTFW